MGRILPVLHRSLQKPGPKGEEKRKPEACEACLRGGVFSLIAHFYFSGAKPIWNLRPKHKLAKSLGRRLQPARSQEGSKTGAPAMEVFGGNPGREPECGPLANSTPCLQNPSQLSSSFCEAEPFIEGPRHAWGPRSHGFISASEAMSGSRHLLLMTCLALV